MVNKIIHYIHFTQLDVLGFKCTSAHGQSGVGYLALRTNPAVMDNLSVADWIQHLAHFGLSVPQPGKK